MKNLDKIQDTFLAKSHEEEAQEFHNIKKR